MCRFVSQRPSAAKRQLPTLNRVIDRTKTKPLTVKRYANKIAIIRSGPLRRRHVQAVPFTSSTSAAVRTVVAVLMSWCQPVCTSNPIALTLMAVIRLRQSTGQMTVGPRPAPATSASRRRVPLAPVTTPTFPCRPALRPPMSVIRSMRRQQLLAEQTRAASPTPPTTALLVERRHRRQLLSLQSSTRTPSMVLPPPVMAVQLMRRSRPSVPAPLIWPHWLMDAAAASITLLTRLFPSLPPNPTPALSVAVNAKHGNATATELYPSDAADINCERRDRRLATPIVVREPAAQDNDGCAVMQSTKRRSILSVVRRGFLAVCRMFYCWRPE